MTLWRVTLALVAVLAFAGSIDGALVWDDTALVDASAQRSVAQVLSSDLFGNQGGAAATANYYRPLVALAFHTLRRLAPEQTLPLHAFGLLAHGLCSVLVFETIRRWLASSATRLGAQPLAVGWLCWLTSLVWVVLPLKAENVAWISGVGDALGFAFLLGGLWLASRQKATAARVGLIALGTVLSLGAKESFVVAPIFVAFEILARAPTAAATDLARTRRDLRILLAPEVWASTMAVVAYLSFRALALPLHGGGAAMFERLSLFSRVALVFESLGHAMHALALPILPSLCRGPIGFESPATLLSDPTALSIGLGGLLAIVAVSVRFPAARLPAFLFLGSLLPCLNLVPAGLEARMSDRYLYVPSYAIALAVSATALSLRPFLQQFVWLALGGLALVLLPLAFLRSRDFRSPEALWMGEVQAGNRAISVLENAAGVAERARHFEDARDLRLLAAQRYGELGFAAGFADRVAALRAQVELTGPADPSTFHGYQRLLDQLLQGEPRALSVPLPERPTQSFQLGSSEAREYAAVHASSTRLELALLLARDGDAKSNDWLEEGLALCALCPAARLLAARVRLAQRDPDRAHELLSLPTIDGAPLAAVIASQRALLATPPGSATGTARVLAAVLGEAYPVACRELHPGAVRIDTPPGPTPAVTARPALAPDADRLICLAAGQAAGATEHEAKLVSELIQSSAARSAFVAKHLPPP